MPALKNQRHEAFCQAYVRGPTAGNGQASYLAVGYDCTGQAAAVAANRLLKNAELLARISELRAQVAKIEEKATELALEKLAITKERVLGELAKIGFANMLDYVQPTPGGDVIVDLSALTRDQAAAIQEVTIDTYLEGRGDDAKEVKRTKFKLANKRDALVDLGKHLGLFVELRKDLSGDHATKTDEEIRNELAAINENLAELLSGGIPAPAGASLEDGGTTAPPRPH